MKNPGELIAFIRRQPRWRLVAAAALILIAGVLWLRSGGQAAGSVPTFAARRGPLEITVLEGGSLQALESQEIKCEVRVGYQGTKILKIVEEGYLVTEDDVRTNKVLCELDGSDLQKQIVQQEIQYQSALATLTDGQQNYEIQLGQNQSDVKAAEQKARFARMDFDKFLGDSVTDQIVKETGMDAFLAAVSTNNVELAAPVEKASGETPPAKLTPPPATLVLANTTANAELPAHSPAPPPPPADTEGEDLAAPALKMPRISVDFLKYANLDALGDGEAKQKLRKLDDDLQVAQKELGQATTALEGTKRLFEKGFATKTEITRDEISHTSALVKVQSSETARALYLKYELPKSAEEALSKFTEGVRELDKARRVAISKLAQARARLNSAKGQYEVQRRQREDLQEQLAKCTLCAEKTGLVVYGGGRDNYYGNQEPIREGATVRERQAIITIPDLKKMSVEVKIHESYIQKIKKGQKARITVDAFPDQPLTGEITKVGVLPDSQNRWMNPDLKVYLTTITIDGTHEWVKPGMSTKAEILVNHLADVVYVPVQAVAPADDKQYCYVQGAFGPDRREIQVGEFNDEFIEVKKGVQEGDLVLLRPPDGAGKENTPKDSKPVEAEPKQPPAIAAEPVKNGKI